MKISDRSKMQGSTKVMQHKANKMHHNRLIILSCCGNKQI